MLINDSILIRAEPQQVFETAADVLNWPRMLPHYRHVKFLDGGGDRGRIHMAAWRGCIPIQWTSDLRVDRARREIHFTHLKSFTRGMRVVWSFEPTADGTRVNISHELAPHSFIVNRVVAEHIIGRHFVHPVASRTLAHMKRHIEATCTMQMK